MAVLTEEQTMLRDAAKGWTTDSAPVGALRKLRDGKSGKSFDAAAWAEMGQMGWAGVIVPEEHNGSAFGYLGLGLVLEETGRNLVASPLLSTALIAASALTLAARTRRSQPGSTRSLWAKRSPPWPSTSTRTTHRRGSPWPRPRSGDGFTLNGDKTFVIDGEAADLLIVAARTSGKPGDTDGLTLFLVSGDAAGVTRAHLALADSRGAAKIRFRGREGRRRRRAGRSRQGLGRARAGARPRLYRPGRRNAGNGQRRLRHHAGLPEDPHPVRPGDRHVPGAAASRVQAVHRPGDHSLLRRGRAGSSGYAGGDTRALASLAKAKASEVLHLASNEMVQMHGGIGMTDAHDSGLYMKRARVAEALFGGASFHRDRYADTARLLIPLAHPP
jgi:alkylation response protein AidB-like acyl-CoA dehydrogenase